MATIYNTVSDHWPTSMALVVHSQNSLTSITDKAIMVAGNAPLKVIMTKQRSPVLLLAINEIAKRGQDYKRFSSMSRCSTHNLCSEMT